VALIVLGAKVAVAGRAALEEGLRAEADGEPDVAIAHHRRALRWFLPIAPWSDAALERLLAIGAAAEENGETARALSAYRSVRAGVMAGRSLWIPHAEALRDADERIAHLMASGDVPPMDARLTEPEREARYLALLEEDRDPTLGWALLALLGFGLWIAGAHGVLTRAIDRDDRVVETELRTWGTVFVLGFGCFALGLALA
jgi:hypothetical protein